MNARDTSSSACSPAVSGPAPIAYGVREACAATGLGRSTLYELIRTKQLTSVKIAGRRLIPRAALEALFMGT